MRKKSELTSLAIKNFLSGCISVKNMVVLAVHYDHITITWMNANHFSFINLTGQDKIINLSSSLQTYVAIDSRVDIYSVESR